MSKFAWIAMFFSLNQLTESAYGEVLLEIDASNASAVKFVATSAHPAVYSPQHVYGDGIWLLDALSEVPVEEVVWVYLEGDLTVTGSPYGPYDSLTYVDDRGEKDARFLRAIRLSIDRGAAISDHQIFDPEISAFSGVATATEFRPVELAFKSVGATGNIVAGDPLYDFASRVLGQWQIVAGGDPRNGVDDPGAGGGNDGVNLSGMVQDARGNKLCALVLTSGQYMFSCDPAGWYSLENLPREPEGTVRRQIYADGYFPHVQDLEDSGTSTIILEKAHNCPNYNVPSNPDAVPGSSGKRHSISGRVLLQSTDTPLCALVLANGTHMFSCDESGEYSLDFPLDQNGQYKLQVYANGFAPIVQKFNEFDNQADVRMARSSECQ